MAPPEEMVLTLVSANAEALGRGAAAAAAVLAPLGVSARLEPLEPGEALDMFFALSPHAREAALGVLGAALGPLPIDWALTAVRGRRKRLLVADMDSTIIGCECLDELADFAGKKAEVATITERAMAGELKFEAALMERVAMLKGLPVSALQACFDARVRLNPGAETFVRTMAANGARCVLVSGGFTFFTSRVAKLAGFAADFSNTFLIEDGALTGAVGLPILGRAAKLTLLSAEAAAHGLTAADALAIGDGANDLDMIKAAGLGLAYRAKPIVAAEADGRIDHGGLERALFFQGYRRREFVS